MQTHQQPNFLRRLMAETALGAEQLAPSSSVTRRYLRLEGAPDLRGFHLTIGAASAVGGASYAWAVESVLPATGKRQRLRVADAKLTTMETAIGLARELKRDMKGGTDPKAEREAEKIKVKERAAAKVALRRTLRELLDEYLARQVKQKRPSAELLRSFFSEPTEATLEAKDCTRLELKPVLRLLGTPAANVTPEAAQKLVRSYETRGLRMAQAALEHLRAAFNVALDDATQAKAFGITANPFARVRVSEAPDQDADEDDDNERGTRALSEKEVAALWHDLHARTTVTAGNGAQLTVQVDARTRVALLLTLATGQRVEQVLKTRIQDLDLKGGVWTIPTAHRKVRRTLRASKRAAAKLPHRVPLHNLAVSLWNEAISLRTNTANPWLFPNTNRKGEEQLTYRDHRTLSKFVSRWCERTEFDHFTPRDLRRTWTTQAGRWRLDYEVRERIMDHALPGIGAKVYDEADYFEPMADLMEAFGHRLAALIGQAASDSENRNVVPLVRHAGAA